MEIGELREILSQIPECYDHLPVTMHERCNHPHLDLYWQALILPPVQVSRAWGEPDNPEVYAK